MNILYVSTISATINAFLIPHIKLLLEMGCHVDVACNETGRLNPKLSRFGVNRHEVPFQRSPLKKENYSAYKRIREIVLNNKYDLIHVHTPTAAFITRFACRDIHNVMMVYTAHGFHFYKGAPLKNWIMYYSLERLAAKWTDGVITINREDFETAAMFKLRRKNSVFYMHGIGVDLNKFTMVNTEGKEALRKQYGYDSNRFIMLYAAELNYNKHQDLLIKAVKILKERHRDVLLLLAGEGNMAEYYKKLSLNMGLEKNVEFLGYRRDIPNLLKTVDAAVSSSRREGLPVFVMEAMASGLPVIVTDTRGNRDLIINSVNGFVVKDEPVLYANAVEKLMQSDELGSNLGKSNLELIQKYALANVLTELSQIYSFYLQ